MVDTNIYKMGQGEYLDAERVQESLTTHFGEISRTETFDITDDNGNQQEITFYVVEDVEPTGLDSIAAGKVSYASKKDRLAVVFRETELQDLDDPSNAREAIIAKNEFLEAATGRSPKNRKGSLRNQRANEMQAGVGL